MIEKVSLGKLSTQPMAVRALTPLHAICASCAPLAPARTHESRCAALTHTRAGWSLPQEGYVPGLGEKGIEKLAENNVESSVQLMGEFLLKKRSRAEFLTLLTKSGGLRAQCAPPWLS